jgi:hypothetical protein
MARKSCAQMLCCKAVEGRAGRASQTDEIKPSLGKESAARVQNVPLRR